jgi:hypothetical protein
MLYIYFTSLLFTDVQWKFVQVICTRLKYSEVYITTAEILTLLGEVVHYIFPHINIQNINFRNTCKDIYTHTNNQSHEHSYLL